MAGREAKYGGGNDIIRLRNPIRSSIFTGGSGSSPPLADVSHWGETSERFSVSASKTIVVQHREGILKRKWKVAWFGRACDAGDRAEIFVNGPQVMIR